MEKFPGVGERVRQRLEALGYWKEGRPDVARFCEEKGYLPQYLYAWLKDRVPGYENLRRLAEDLQVSTAWLLLGDEGVGQPAPATRRAGLPPRTREGIVRGRGPQLLGRYPPKPKK